MIVGIGLDLTEIPRIHGMVERWGDRFVKRIFTPSEREYCQSKAMFARHYAARFAAKEACLKALSVPPGLSWHEMEVGGGGTMPPTLTLRGAALEAVSRASRTRLAPACRKACFCCPASGEVTDSPWEVSLVCNNRRAVCAVWRGILPASGAVTHHSASAWLSIVVSA